MSVHASRVRVGASAALGRAALRGREAGGVPTFRMGINYWPRHSAMYMWERFDIGEIREDFARLADLRLGTVRFFLRWDAFQPEAERMDTRMLERLIELMDALQENRLVGMPTLFTGHMSGVNWLPQWTLDPKMPHGRFRTYTASGESPYGIGDFYTGELLAAQTMHVREVGAALRGHPALWMWDLGNEFSNLREPAREEDGAHWSRTLTEAVQEASGAPVTGGTHGEDITRDRNIRLSSMAAPWRVPTMHGYSVYSAFARSRLDSDVVPFLCQVAQSCAAKAVLFSEFGNPTCPPGTVSPYDRVPLPRENVQQNPNSASDSMKHGTKKAAFACLTEDEMCEYAGGVLDRLQKRGALGAFWWCYADYAKDLETLPPFDKAAHELTFGIVRQDGTPKPIAETLLRFSCEEREVVAPPAAIVEEARYFADMPQSVQRAYDRYVETFP